LLGFGSVALKARCFSWQRYDDVLFVVRKAEQGFSELVWQRDRSIAFSFRGCS